MTLHFESLIHYLKNELFHVLVGINAHAITYIHVYICTTKFYRIDIDLLLGLTSTTIPMYLAECSPANERGRLVSTNIAMVACGQFVASVVDGIFGWCQYDVGWR